MGVFGVGRVELVSMEGVEVLHSAQHLPGHGHSLALKVAGS